jgi:hypothetical protein
MPWPFRTKSQQQVVQTAKDAKKQQEDRQKELEAAHPSARFPATQVVFTDVTFAEPPTLNYSLQPRMKSILIFWFLVFIDCICMPLILYFVLWYKTSLSHNAGIFKSLSSLWSDGY